MMRRSCSVAKVAGKPPKSRRNRHSVCGRLQKLEEAMIREKAKLIVLDSVAALVRRRVPDFRSS